MWSGGGFLAGSWFGGLVIEAKADNRSARSTEATKAAIGFPRSSSADNFFYKIAGPA
jgi:hypothetical protein